MAAGEQAHQEARADEEPEEAADERREHGESPQTTHIGHRDQGEDVEGVAVKHVGRPWCTARPVDKVCRNQGHLELFLSELVTDVPEGQVEVADQDLGLAACSFCVNVS